MTDTSKMVFVFGSNLAGRHGAGAAKYAKDKRGAAYGVGVGMTGECYALPTKDRNIVSLSLSTIRIFVGDFIRHASAHPSTEFQVTQIGCGLAGFKASDIAPMFVGAPKNCHFDTDWKPYLGEDRNYWGHL